MNLILYCNKYIETTILRQPFQPISSHALLIPQRTSNTKHHQKNIEKEGFPARQSKILFNISYGSFATNSSNLAAICAFLNLTIHSSDQDRSEQEV